eukprot:766865-Hanusia_phi.AAC.7
MVDEQTKTLTAYLLHFSIYAVLRRPVKKAASALTPATPATIPLSPSAQSKVALIVGVAVSCGVVVLVSGLLIYYWRSKVKPRGGDFVSMTPGDFSYPVGPIQHGNMSQIIVTQQGNEGSGVAAIYSEQAKDPEGGPYTDLKGQRAGEEIVPGPADLVSHGEMQKDRSIPCSSTTFRNICLPDVQELRRSANKRGFTCIYHHHHANLLLEWHNKVSGVRGLNSRSDKSMFDALLTLNGQWNHSKGQNRVLQRIAHEVARIRAPRARGNLWGIACKDQDSYRLSTSCCCQGVQESEISCFLVSPVSLKTARIARGAVNCPPDGVKCPIPSSSSTASSLYRCFFVPLEACSRTRRKRKQGKPRMKTPANQDSSVLLLRPGPTQLIPSIATPDSLHRLLASAQSKQRAGGVAGRAGNGRWRARAISLALTQNEKTGRRARLTNDSEMGGGIGEGDDR